jgi:flagellar motor component MotA
MAKCIHCDYPYSSRGVCTNCGSKDPNGSAYLGDNRHRSIFHHTAGAYYMQKMFGVDFDAIERIKNKYKLDDDFVSELLQLFKTNRQQGVHILNSENKKIHVRDIAEQHILDDFRGKFMPTVSDYLSNMTLRPWMDNALTSIYPKEEKKLAVKGTINVD